MNEQQMKLFAEMIGDAIRSCSQGGERTHADFKDGLRLVERSVDTSIAIERFSGDSGLVADEWLKQLQAAKRTGQWTEEFTRSVLFTKMAGPARSWYRNHATELSFEDFETKFREAYIPKRNDALILDELYRCRQGKNETLEVFARRVENLALELKLSADGIKDHILKGLNAEYSYLIHGIRAKNHADVSALIRDISDTMAFNRMLSGRRLEPASSDVDQRRPRQLICFQCGQQSNGV